MAVPIENGLCKANIVEDAFNGGGFQAGSANLMHQCISKIKLDHYLCTLYMLRLALYGPSEISRPNNYLRFDLRMGVHTGLLLCVCGNDQIMY